MLGRPEHAAGALGMPGRLKHVNGASGILSNNAGRKRTPCLHNKLPPTAYASGLAAEIFSYSAFWLSVRTASTPAVMASAN